MNATSQTKSTILSKTVISTPKVAANEPAMVPNRFSELMTGTQILADQSEISYSANFEQTMIAKADGLVARLEAAHKGIITRVDVDDLFMLKHCVNSLVNGGADSNALKYAHFVKQWCESAAFVDNVATGTAMTAAADICHQLCLFDDAARLFKISASMLEATLDYQHPLTTYSRDRYKITLTKLAQSGRKKFPSNFGVGYLRLSETPRLCPLVWEGPISP